MMTPPPRLWDPPFKAAPPSETGTPLADGTHPPAPPAPLPPEVAQPFTQLHERATHPTDQGGERS